MQRDSHATLRPRPCEVKRSRQIGIHSQLPLIPSKHQLCVQTACQALHQPLPDVCVSTCARTCAPPPRTQRNLPAPPRPASSQGCNAPSATRLAAASLGRLHRLADGGGARGVCQAQGARHQHRCTLCVGRLPFKKHRTQACPAAARIAASKL
jgi:hypothetical protein